MGRRGCWDSRGGWSGGGKGLPFERRRGWRETDDEGWLVEMAQAGGGGGRGGDGSQGKDRSKGELIEQGREYPGWSLGEERRVCIRGETDSQRGEGRPRRGGYPTVVEDGDDVVYSIEQMEESG